MKMSDMTIGLRVIAEDGTLATVIAPPDPPELDGNVVYLRFDDGSHDIVMYDFDPDDPDPDPDGYFHSTNFKPA